MTTPIIRLNKVSLCYKIYNCPADIFWEFLFRRPRHRDFWALEDISLEIPKGEVLGIIGKNGAGKTTLLQILAGLLLPSQGEVEVHGRVSTIMALGIGLNPELTGRENIILGGLFNGRTEEEMKEKTEAIVEFSDLGEFIDHPLKTYSSGMQARISFSIAASVDPDILIIDEALAVGDIAFISKCYRRIREIVSSGATVLFVSHAMNNIYDLCSRVLWLDNGHQRMIGDPQKVGREYENELYREIAKQNRQLPPTISYGEQKYSTSMEKSHIPGLVMPECVPDKKTDPCVSICGLEILDCNNNPIHVLEQDHTYQVLLTLYCREYLPRISAGFHIKTQNGSVAYGISTGIQDVSLEAIAGTFLVVRFCIPCRLQCGSYSFWAAVSEFHKELDHSNIHLSTMLHAMHDAKHITVIGANLFGGTVDMQGEYVSSEKIVLNK